MQRNVMCSSFSSVQPEDAPVLRSSSLLHSWPYLLPLRRGSQPPGSSSSSRSLSASRTWRGHGDGDVPVAQSCNASYQPGRRQTAPCCVDCNHLEKTKKMEAMKGGKILAPWIVTFRSMEKSAIGAWILCFFSSSLDSKALSVMATSWYLILQIMKLLLHILLLSRKRRRQHYACRLLEVARTCKCILHLLHLFQLH